MYNLKVGIKSLIQGIVRKLGYEIHRATDIGRLYSKINNLESQLQVKETSLQELKSRIMDFDSVNRPYSVYSQDGLMSIHDNEFMTKERFTKAYQRGIRSANGTDYKWHWRVHIGLWAAYTCSKIEGDFVECGVGNGFLSSAILEYLPWHNMNKHFYLFDTFEGIDSRYVTPEELKIIGSVKSHNKKAIEAGFYCSNYKDVEENFREWDRVHFIKGAIPDTLGIVQISKVSYLHIDMNCLIPEVAAIKYFYPKLNIGSIVLLDDYAYNGHHEQKKAMDKWASLVGAEILSLPTGQGMLIKTG